MSAQTRVQLMNADRKVICELRQANKDLSQERLTRLAAAKIGKEALKRSTVTCILKQSSKWLSSAQLATKKVMHRAAQRLDLESALYACFHYNELLVNRM